MARNGLMIAMLALCPIRLRGFAGLRIGKNFIQIGDRWWIMLDGTDTKSGRPDGRPVREMLTPYIEGYLECRRLRLPNPGDALWPSSRGRAMSRDTIYGTITKTTTELLGSAVNPHLFRNCAVSTIAHIASNCREMASALLQHADPADVRERAVRLVLEDASEDGSQWWRDSNQTASGKPGAVHAHGGPDAPEAIIVLRSSQPGESHAENSDHNDPVFGDQSTTSTVE